MKISRLNAERGQTQAAWSRRLAIPMIHGGDKERPWPNGQEREPGFPSYSRDHRAARSYWNIAAGLSMIHLTPCMVMSKLTVKER